MHDDFVRILQGAMVIREPVPGMSQQSSSNDPYSAVRTQEKNVIARHHTTKDVYINLFDYLNEEVKYYKEQG